MLHIITIKCSSYVESFLFEYNSEMTSGLDAETALRKAVQDFVETPEGWAELRAEAEAEDVAVNWYLALKTVPDDFLSRYGIEFKMDYEDFVVDGEKLVEPTGWTGGLDDTAIS